VTAGTPAGQPAARTPGDRLVELADELRAMSANGLHYTHDDYDRERYKRITDIAAELAAMADTRDAADIERAYRGSLTVLTPAVGATAAIFDEAGRLFMTRRADNGRWCMPGGAAEVGEAPSATAVRETEEETGLRVVASALIALYDGRRLPVPAHLHHAYHLVFACDLVGGEPTVTSEVTDFTWCTEPQAMALPLSGTHIVKVPDVFAWHRDPTRLVFD
jgi:8-oxo-dGTP pyrophosphatase MutT (NUDIX family)